MARVGEEFPLECPGCGGDIRLIAFITEPGPIRKILTPVLLHKPLTAFHATVRTAREKSGFKAGLRRREKSGLERG